MANKQLHLIYVPGLGDYKITGQLRAVARWPKQDVTAELFQMNWADKEPWPPKFERLLTRIDSALAEDKDVGLVGVSAGASAVINAFTARKDHVIGCVLIAGKVNRPHHIGGSFFRDNPAFVTSAHACEAALTHLTSDDRRRILSRFAVLDETVYKADSRIPGAKNQIVPSIGHFMTIATQITLGVPSFVKFLKQLQAQQL